MEMNIQTVYHSLAHVQLWTRSTAVPTATARNCCIPAFFCEFTPSHAPSPRTLTSMPIKFASSSKNLLHSVQHDLEQIADHVIVVEVQHE